MWSWSFARHGLADPLLFHALTSSSALALMMMKGPSRAMQGLFLWHETQASQLMRKEVSNGIREPRDELLFAFILLIRKTDKIIKLGQSRTFGAFRPPLTELQNLNTGSSLSYGTTHLNILGNLMSQKGGLTKIAIPGLAEFFNT